MNRFIVHDAVMSLDDLKHAIEAMPRKPKFADYIDDPALYDNHMRAYFDMERYAWRTAFEWRHKWADLRDSAMSESMQREYDEGMCLIREKLS